MYTSNGESPIIILLDIVSVSRHRDAFAACFACRESAVRAEYIVPSKYLNTYNVLLVGTLLRQQRS